jgi:DNA-binding NtrC family response regulator
LKNSIKKATLFADEVIEAEHLRSSALGGESATSLDGLLENAFVKGLPLAAINEVIRKALERRIIERVYEQAHHNKKKTCQALGIDYSTLYRKMKEYGFFMKLLTMVLADISFFSNSWFDRFS